MNYNYELHNNLGNNINDNDNNKRPQLPRLGNHNQNQETKRT